MMKKLLMAVVCALLCTCIAFSMTSCSKETKLDMNIKAVDLMNGIKPSAHQIKTPDDEFIKAQADFAVDLLKSNFKAFGEGKAEGRAEKDNALVSPLSVMLALSMTANGSENETKKEMEKLLGGSLTIEQLNEYLCCVLNNAPNEEKCKLNIANSIWVRQGFDVKQDFLQTNADYYNASVYEAAFDRTTVDDINNWVNINTDEMIEKIVESLDSDTVMCLINALAFDAEWEKVYKENEIIDGKFNCYNGEETTVEMMHSKEARYLDDGNAKGFVKNYKCGKFSFAALLPNDGVDIYDYIDGLTGEGLVKTLKGASSESIEVALPKFEYSYGITLNDSLKNMGMSMAFNETEADFSKITDGQIFISEVLHKTYISVDEMGTRAGAVTAVMMTEGALADKKYVILDRPFVYMIVDNSTNLPIFIGANMNM